MLKSFYEIIVEETLTEDKNIYILEEGFFGISPSIALLAFKNKILGKMKFIKFNKYNAAKLVQPFKAGIDVGVEQIKSDIGKSKDTLYKFLPEQKKVMADIYSKYGSELNREIMLFRRNVLAPYQVIKRIVRKYSTITNKDVFGMAHGEFKVALESGRKKILKRGNFFEKNEGYRDRIEDLNSSNERLNTLYNGISNDPPEINQGILEKVYTELNISRENLGGRSLEDLRRVVDEIERNVRQAQDIQENDPENYKGITDLLSKNVQLRTGQGTTSKKDELHKLLSTKGFSSSEERALVKNISKTIEGLTFKRTNFASVLGKYLFRKDVLRTLKNADSNEFKNIYQKIIKNLISENKELIDLYRLKMQDSYKTINFTDNEKKIWKLRPFAQGGDLSGELQDYKQMIKDEDFLQQNVNIKKDPKVLEAEQEINKNVKAFENKLAKIVTAEDLDKLKKYRIINNPITIKELIDPNKLFISNAEENNQKFNITDQPAKESSKEGTGKFEDFTSEEVFVRKMKEWATMEYDSMKEFNRSKDEAKDLIDKIKKQESEEWLDKYDELINQVLYRKTTEKRALKGIKSVYPNEIITIDDVEDFAKEIIRKKYTNVDNIKQDKLLLDKMIEKYKEDEEEADRNLEEIDFVLTQVKRKLEGELGDYIVGTETK